MNGFFKTFFVENNQVNGLSKMKSPFNPQTNAQSSPKHLVGSNQASPTTIAQQQSYGNPSSRQDAVLLMQWFEKMVNLVQFETGPEQLENITFPYFQIVLNICLKELSRQVSVQCQERGQMLKMVFRVYVNLINILNSSFKSDRLKMKKEFSEKLDRYVSLQQDQLKKYKDQVADLQNTIDHYKSLNEQQIRNLNAGQILQNKFKRKLYILQTLMNQSLKQHKFLDIENTELKRRVKELQDRLGEDDGKHEVMNQQEHENLMDRVDKQVEEMLTEKQIDLLPDKHFIKEEDKETDMSDFQKYLIETFGEQVKDKEIQTTIKQFRNFKIGVNLYKMNLLKDSATMVEDRIFGITSRGLNSHTIRVENIDKDSDNEEEKHADIKKVQDSDQSFSGDESGKQDKQEGQSDEDSLELGDEGGSQRQFNGLDGGFDSIQEEEDSFETNREFELEEYLQDTKDYDARPKSTRQQHNTNDQAIQDEFQQEDDFKRSKSINEKQMKQSRRAKWKANRSKSQFINTKFSNSMIKTKVKTESLSTLIANRLSKKLQINMEMRSQKRTSQFITDFNNSKERFNKNIIKDHPAYTILKKIQKKDKKQLKHTIGKRTLLRIIYQIYSEKTSFEIPLKGQSITNQIQESPSQTGSSFNQQQAVYSTVITYVYDTFLQKYGFKKIAESKFKQVITECILLQDDCPRIKLFGRFLEIYDELTLIDYNKYQEMVEIYSQQILNFKINDDDAIIYLPYAKAVETFKQKYESKFIPSAYQKRLQKIDKMRIFVSPEKQKELKHLKRIREAVDFDQFIEFLIETTNFLHNERDQLIKDAYLAVDVNNDGMMSALEFQMLMKVFHYRSSAEINKIFNEYAEFGIDENEPNIKYINLNAFQNLCRDKDFFNPKAQMIFLKSSNFEKDYKNLESNIDTVIEVFRGRLEQIQLTDDPDFEELIENFQSCMKFPFSSRVAWFTFRIVDEILKRSYLKRLSDMLMPVELKKLGIKLSPSPNILALSPVIQYESL